MYECIEKYKNLNEKSYPNLYYNPSAQSFYTDYDDVNKAVRPVSLYAEKQERLMPGSDNGRAMNLIYEYCLSKAYDDTVGISEEEGRTHLILTRLAGYCQESGLAMAVAQRLAMFSLTRGS